MQEHQTQSSSDEIDLGVVFKRLRSFFKSILIGIIQIFQFFWKHKVRLIIILIVGVGIQLLLLSLTKKIFTNEYLIRTNFDSTEYLYSKVDFINQKIDSKDTVYLKAVFGEHYKAVKELEVVPVIDVYGLVNKSEDNKETFKLLLEEYGNVSFLEEDININEYPNHKLRIFVKGAENNDILSQQLYRFLDQNSFYKDIKEIALKNYEEQIEQNNAIRAQIDSIIKEQKGYLGSLSQLDNNAISFTGSQDMRGLLSQKRELLYENLDLYKMLASEDEVLKIIDSSFGVLSKDNNPNRYLISIFLLVSYCLIYFFVFLSKKVKRFIKE